MAPGPHFLLTFAPSQVQEVEKLSGALERGGLYTICALLLLAVIYLFVSRDRQRDKQDEERKAHQTKLLQLIAEQTQVITKQVLLTERVEVLLQKNLTTLEKR